MFYTLNKHNHIINTNININTGIVVDVFFYFLNICTIL